MTPGYQRVIPGCLLMVLMFACVSVLAVLAILKGDVGASARTADDMNFINPRANHFGFLWLTTTLAATVLTPVYAVRVILATIVFRFDRGTGLFTRNGKKIAPLGKVECVRILHSDDPDNRALHKLVVLHSDGFETPLDNWYDEPEMNHLAREIAEFCNVRVVGLREDTYEDGGLVSRSEFGVS